MPYRWGLGTHETWTEGVEENLERPGEHCEKSVRKGGIFHVREEDFAEYVVEAEKFEASGKVGVDSILTQMLVVLYVILL